LQLRGDDFIESPSAGYAVIGFGYLFILFGIGGLFGQFAVVVSEFVQWMAAIVQMQFQQRRSMQTLNALTPSNRHYKNI
jgi:hypothetical protein